jgi:DNA-binding LytR/AlgR family response regulator
MNILIIEDDEAARKKLISYIKLAIADFNIVDLLGSVQEVKKFFSKKDRQNIDLIISDVELTDGNIFEYFSRNKTYTPTIYSTSYDKYRIDALNSFAVAYLIKPYNYQTFLLAISKYEKFTDTVVKSAINDLFKPKTTVENIFDSFIIAINDKSIYNIPVSSVLFFYLSNRHIYFVDVNNSIHQSTESVILSLLKKLDPDIFIRVNDTQVININFIEKVEYIRNNRILIKLRKNENTFEANYKVKSILRKHFLL